MSSSSIYTTGGTVQAGGGIYLPRRADDELLELCRAGQFAYVLTPRQMGKSSLMVRTAQRLEAEGATSIVIDLTKIGTEVTAEQWYLGLLTEIDDALMLDTDIFDWWEAHQHLGVTQRLTRFFEEVLLAEVSGQLVVFVDEIDTTLSLDFTDDFFIAIRYFYVARAQQAELGRLSFVLIGVATPGDLIRDPQRTPFNVGQRVDLTDFTLEDALPFAKGLGANGEQVLGWVMDWSGGHPYLTQRLCQGISETSLSPGPSAKLGEGKVDQASVKQLVEKLFLEGGDRHDNNLLFVRDMLTQRTPNRNESVYEVLMTYRDIWLGKQPVLDEEQSLIKSHLKLTGIVRREADRQGTLRVSNGIYREVFDGGWVKEHLPTNWVKRLQRARALIAALLVVTLVAVPLGMLAELRRREAVEQRAEAEKQTKLAQAQTILAEANASRAFLLVRQPLKGMVAAVTAWQTVEEDGLQDVSMAQPARSALLGGAYYESVFNRNNLQIKYFSKQVFREKNFLKGPGRELSPGKELNSVAFSPDGQAIASASSNGTVQLWDRQGNLLNILEGGSDWVVSVAFSPDGQTLASASADGTVKLWDRQGNLLNTIEAHYSQMLRSVAFSPDGQTLASASADGTVKLWDRQGNLLKTIESYSEAVISVAFSPDGQTLAFASTDGTIKLWDRQGNLLNTLESYSGWVYSVAFSPDGQTLASASADGTVKLWDRQGNLPRTLEGHSARVNGVTFSPDGQTVASASDDRTVKLWDRQGNLLNTLEGHSREINSVAFSPDGQTLASASDDRTVKLWERQGSLLNSLEGHSGRVRSVAFSPDGQTVASVSDDNTVKLWDRQGNLLNTLEGHSGEVNGVAFSPDGQTVASASDDRTVKLWDRNPQRLLAWHCNWLQDYLLYNPDGKKAAAEGVCKGRL